MRERSILNMNRIHAIPVHKTGHENHPSDRTHPKTQFRLLLTAGPAPSGHARAGNDRFRLVAHLVDDDRCLAIADRYKRLKRRPPAMLRGQQQMGGSL